LCAFILGIGAMVGARGLEGAHQLTADLLNEIGAALWISVALAVFWDLAGKRAFADEIIAKVGMSRSLAQAGVEKIIPSFQQLDWSPLFHEAQKLDLFVSYAASWRNYHILQLKELLSKPDAALRVLLPDPAIPELVSALAVRFEKTAAEMQKEINDAWDFFAKTLPAGRAEIYFTCRVPLFSFYIFDTKAVLALYNHRLGRLPVPTFFCNDSGFLFSYLAAEFEGILADANCTRKV
jgi:hypothetical protein